MSLLNDALRAGLRPAAPPPAASALPAGPRRAVVVGGAGPLGSAVLERLLAGGGFAAVATLVTQPLEAALRGFEAWPVSGRWGAGQAPAGAGQRADTAVLVFDRERATRHGRERAFFRPQPADLAPLGAWLLAAGVRRLVVVMPHAPALLPQALRLGLASLDEQALAALDFEHLVFVRPTRDGMALPAAQPAGWGHRVARGLLSQLHWMVPQREQPLRAQRVAQFVTDLARSLPASPPGTRVVPPELLWHWAQPGGGEPVLAAWLLGQAPPALTVPAARW